MSSDRMKKAHNRGYQHPSLECLKVMDGRYVRFSWRYNSWQFEDKLARTWRNIRPELARALVSAGYRVGVGDTQTEWQQGELFATTSLGETQHG